MLKQCLFAIALILTNTALAQSFPSSVKPGETATLHFETAGADPGIYFIKVQAEASGMSKSFDLALVVN